RRAIGAVRDQGPPATQPTPAPTAPSSKLEARRTRRISQWLHMGLKEIQHVIPIFGNARDDSRDHRRIFANDGRQAASNFQLVGQLSRNYRQQDHYAAY